ncbi:glycosyltransferase family 4 protein [Myxosarcina sp. GI1]|uniref:glycosyltransferase family 4 protein n=1 Tax=Myxosarcina sp. GI1 TaxID=1541065 RepID=UPI000561607F|nr:glycosyltransferase family 4 protein [Myxosarcina sp. GI1]
MKILHICALGVTAQTLLLPQVDYLLARGLEVEIACSVDEGTKELREKGYIVHSIQIDRRIDPITNFKSILQLTKLIRQQQYDLVHVHTPIAAVLGRVAAKLAGVKRIVYTSHGLPFHDRSSPREYFLYSNIEKFCSSISDLIISQNHEDIATAKRLGIAPQKLKYLGNGVDLDRFNRHRLDERQQSQLRRSLNIPNSTELIIGTVGRLTRKKGMGYLIEAAARLIPQFPNLQITIVGGELNTDPEPFYDELVARITELGIANHVIFTGERKDIPELLGLMDIFTLPTFTHEGLPRSIVEAMAMSLPVVATDIRGCREIVQHERTGFVVPPEDSNSLAEALAKLLANAELRKAYGEAGRSRIEAEYDEKMVFERLAKFYQDLGIVIPH